MNLPAFSLDLSQIRARAIRHIEKAHTSGLTSQEESLSININGHSILGLGEEYQKETILTYQPSPGGARLMVTVTGAGSNPAQPWVQTSINFAWRKEGERLDGEE